MTSPTLVLLTRVLASLKHLHTLHGPCDDSPSGDGKTCPHAALIAELEEMEALASASTLADPDSTFQAVAPFPCEEPTHPLSHDPHDLASAIIKASTGYPAYDQAVARFKRSLHPEPLPRLCAARGAEIPATEHPDTNLCGRCSK